MVTLGEQRCFFWDLRYSKCEKAWGLDKLRADFGQKSAISMASGLFLGRVTLFTGSYEGKIYVWEREKLQTTVKAHSGPIFEMKLNVEQKSFITCSSDGLIKIWSTLPGGVFAHEILQVLQVNVVIVHVSVMDESREALGYLMLKPHESLKDVRNLIETSHSSSVYIDNRIRSMIQNVREFLFVTNRGKNLIREKNEELNLAKDLYSEICLVLGQDRIDMMIDSEEVTDIDRLVTRPEGIVDQCKVRMASFEMHHSEIRSVDWHNDSIVFGTQEHLLFGLDSLKGRRSPEQLSNAISGSEVSAMCSHPYLPLFYTASTDGVVQIWDQESKYCTQTRSFTVAVQAMDIAPDGYYLLLATSTGCLALAASNLEELHWIHYRPQRICSIRAVRFSFDGHHLATGTSEGRVDYFDVHGRIRLTEWLTEKLEIELDAGGLEVDFSDGVLLCKLIEVVLFPFTDGRMVTELKSYAIVVDRPPSLAAWKNRPKTYAQKVSLMGEGLEIVLLAAAQAKFIYDRTLADQDDPTYRPWESREQKEDTKGLILQRLQIIRKGESKFHARDLVGDLKPVDRANLFEFCRFVKAMDVTILNAQRDDLQELKVLRTEMQNFSSQSKLAERDQSKGLDSINETAQRLKFAIASHNVLTAQALELDSKLQERQQRHFADRFNEIQALVAKSQKKYNLLVYKMDRAKEEIFIFLGSGKGPSPHNKPVTEIDWSKDGLVAQSVALDSGELNYWKTNGLQQLWPEDCANADWATHHSPLGWAVSGLTRFECMEKQYFTKLNRGPPDSDSSHLLGIGDNTGRVLITQYPFPCNVAEIDLYMEDTFDLEIGFDRITVEAESELISELAVLLTVSKTRLSLIKSTGPAKLTVNIAPPICSEDKRSAFELSVAALACLEHGKMRPFKLLRHCKLVDVPAAFTGIGHSEPVAAIAFDGMGERILSVGKSDMTICVWRILRPENREKGRKIHDKVQRHVEVRICQAVEFLRLGDGTRIEESIIHFLQEWDIAKSGLVTKAVDPVVRLVKELQTTEMKADLTRRGVDIVDLNERDEIAARLCTAMTTPETMTIVEIRSELAKAKVPSGNVFERADLIRLLLSQRQEGTEYPRPIPFEYQRVAPTHKLIIARAKSRWAPSTGGAKHKVSLKDREKEALEILDAVCNLDMLEAQSLGVDQKLWSLIVLIKSNRLEIAATCARNKLYHDTVRKGININEIQTKNPNDVDWLIAGVPPETDPKSLKKGGELYEAAAKAAGGTLLSGRWYQFKDFPGREFEYVRYNERWEFSDQLIEHWSAALSSKTNRQPQRVSGLKNSRWGSLFYAKSLGNIVKAQSLPLQLRKNSQKILSTAYLYQVPVGIPRLRDRVLPSAVQIEDFFTSLDKSRVGSIDMESFEGVVEASMHQLHQCEVLGLPVQNSKDALIIKELIFPCCVLAADSGADSDDMGIKSKLQCTDLFDFFFPNINVLGHLTFKVRIVRLGGEVKIGFVDVSRISRGVPLESDWLWPGHPTWYIDSEGSLYQFGRKVSQATTRLVEKQIILADLDQNLVKLLSILFFVSFA